MESIVLPRNGALIFLRGGRKALGSDQGTFLGRHKVWGREQEAEEGTYIRVTLSGEIVAEGPLW